MTTLSPHQRFFSPHSFGHYHWLMNLGRLRPDLNLAPQEGESHLFQSGQMSQTTGIKSCRHKRENSHVECNPLNSWIHIWTYEPSDKLGQPLLNAYRVHVTHHSRHSTCSSNLI
jgi:hypothetical protein